MQASKHYSRPPITEAVIDFQVDLPEEVGLSTLIVPYVGIKADYPTHQELMIFQGQMIGGSSVEAKASQTKAGYIFSSSDRKQIFQSRLDGFAFSRLAPYDRWQSFRDEVIRLWEIYQLATQPKHINRLIVRYINRLDLPLPLKDFKDYLRTVPEVSPVLPQGLSGYFMQLQIPQEDLIAMLLLNQALVPSASPDVASILLDINISRNSDIPSDKSSIGELLEQIHERVNEVFEGCITEETRRLIE